MPSHLVEYSEHLAPETASACRTEYSKLLEAFTGAHQSANCTQLSKFLTYATT
jgi:hypothetical protein